MTGERRKIRSVLAQDCRDFDLIVVDQTLKHDDATTEFLRATTDPRFHYVVVQPPSLPAARNYGIEKAKGDIAVFIDDDVTLAAGFLEAHRGAYEGLNVFGVAGRVTGPTDPLAHKLYGLNVLGRGVGSFNYHTAETAFSARGCNMSFRREELLRIGGFDTRFSGSACREDTDVSIRIGSRRGRIIFCLPLH